MSRSPALGLAQSRGRNGLGISHAMLLQYVARRLFFAACVVGRPIGGIRPRRIYRYLAHAGFKEPRPVWTTTARGLRMKLCPFYQLDREILACGQYDGPLHAYYDRHLRPGMTCFDVGANIGDSTLHLAMRVGRNGRVHAYEPAPGPLRRLRENIAANAFQDRVEVHEVALADRGGTAMFSYAEHAVENQGMGSLVNHHNDVVSTTIDVTLKTLDQVASEIDLISLDLVKLDIQGSELMFLAGGQETLRRLRPAILLEVSPVELACIHRRSCDLIAAVESLGYRVHLLQENGVAGPVLRSCDVTPDFSASNVVCLPN